MARRRKLGRVVIDTSVVVRAARAFTWLYSQEILDEYREILRRLKVPKNAAGRFVNLLGQGGEEVIQPVEGEFSPNPQDDPFYHCAIAGDADYIITDNVRDFPPVPGKKHPRIIKPTDAVGLLRL
jgi:predicted nucleic acid-binding protein